MDAPSSECLICEILKRGPGERAWHDRVLYTHHEFSVIPGVGPQAEGYLLIVPSTHAHSSAELGVEAIGRLEQTMRDVSHVLNQAYGPCIFFEHGACGTRNLAGGCIDHVHIHALPTRADVMQVARERMRFSPLADLAQLSEWSGRPYVAVQDQAGELFVATGKALPGQFMRRMVAESLGKPDDWDYEAFRGEPVIQATIDKLEPLFNGMQTTERPGRSEWQGTSADAPLVYVARAVDNRDTAEVIKTGEVWQNRLVSAGFRPVDPVVTPFSKLPTSGDPNRANFLRVTSDLAWLRRSDALVIDMSLDGWSYVGCVCELVYAYSWGVPTIVMTGNSAIGERLWLRYHASAIVKSVDDVVEALLARFPMEHEG
jgi:ATP adenylyltransferase